MINGTWIQLDEKRFVNLERAERVSFFPLGLPGVSNTPGAVIMLGGGMHEIVTDQVGLGRLQEALWGIRYEREG